MEHRKFINHNTSEISITSIIFDEINKFIATELPLSELNITYDQLIHKYADIVISQKIRYMENMFMTDKGYERYLIHKGQFKLALSECQAINPVLNEHTKIIGI